MIQPSKRVEEIVKDFESRMLDIDCSHWGECYIASDSINCLKDWLTQALTEIVEEEIKKRDMFVMGWRENDWPEKFDRYTAQIIADKYEQLFLTTKDNQK